MLLSGDLLGCSSYDPKLIGGQPQNPNDGGSDVVDSGSPDASTDSSVVDSRPNQTSDCQQHSTCRLEHAVAVCSEGECLVAACEAGFVDCNDIAADGCEATLDSVEHCGVCRHGCTFANGSSRCSDGTCELAECELNFGDCDGSRDNGCERTLTTLSNCGACGTSCSLANAVTNCDTGHCSFSKCSAGFGDCNGDGAKLIAGDGCETKLDTPEHCGTCDTKCSGATPYCSGGRCTGVVCDPGRADCDNDNVMCEADLTTLSNCGACGQSCGPLSNATATCATGQCTATCQSGFKDCDNTLANGCETNTRTTSNCGDCGRPCTYVNATTSCSSGACALASCTSGYGDCNANLTQDGCEQRLNTLSHCGNCNQACKLANAASSCSSGSCQVGSCNTGFANCDGRADTGCETNLMTSNQSCGACNSACPSNRTCSGGRCVCTSNSNCNSGQTCCNGACVDQLSDEANCGSCSNVCASGSTCCSGTCRNLATDFNNCGNCGDRCDSDKENRCTNGECRCANSDSCPAFWRCCSSGCKFGLGC